MGREERPGHLDLVVEHPTRRLSVAAAAVAEAFAVGKVLAPEPLQGLQGHRPAIVPSQARGGLQVGGGHHPVPVDVEGGVDEGGGPLVAGLYKGLFPGGDPGPHIVGL